jgi:FkbM family methyltransferase
LDVGAHAGQFSKLFARLAPNGQVIAFEPSAYARSILTPALCINGCRNVTIVPKGLSDAPSEMTLHTPIKRRGGLGFGAATLGATERQHHSQKVELVTLDSLGLPRVDFIKADIEGWEAHMLRGGARTIEAHLPVLYLEVNQSALEQAGTTRQEILDHLILLGYEATPFTSDDYLFVPEGRRGARSLTS